MKPIARNSISRGLGAVLRLVGPLSITASSWAPFAAIGTVGCSGVESQPDTSRSRAPRTKAQAITTNCSMDLVGLPCDPDGGGDATECEGLCWIGADRSAQCLPIASAGLSAEDMNGRICGDASGSSCEKSCENGQCVAKNARLGAACRPLGLGNACEGLCTLRSGSPYCELVTACREVGVHGCFLRACELTDNSKTGCVDYPLDAGTRCDDGNACSDQDTCDGHGQCNSGVESCIGTGGAGAGGQDSGAAGGRNAEAGAAGAVTVAGTTGEEEAGSGPGGAAGQPAIGPAGESHSGGSDSLGGAAGAAGASGSGETKPRTPSNRASQISGGGCQLHGLRVAAHHSSLLGLLGALALRVARRRRRGSTHIAV
ncbi:MAG TPA: hypothetical protein VFQ61_11330 [Polyangiaceae bacterium]|nr:hypothetical protein [Polyangiaceae bacterium]